MTQINVEHRVPEASICINKSRLKLYNKDNTPTYYLNNGQEFQIELYNPTQNTVLAKIEINGNPISQGGLVLKPAERVFLERYLDVAKKFLFETYEVSNTKEVQKAIENNGGVKIQFYNEYIPQPVITTNYPYDWYLTTYGTSNQPIGQVNNFYSRSANLGGSYDTGGNIPVFGSASAGDFTYTNSSNESLSFEDNNLQGTLSNAKSKKSIETGRVESGSNSNQQLKYVDKTFSYYAFHTIELKLLPISQKINTTKDIKIGLHCTNCGAKAKPTHKFCASCGKKL